MGNIAKLSELSQAKRQDWIDRLFARFGAMYGKHFADMWMGQDMAAVKSIWADELSDMTTDEIARGVAACRNRKWPPTLPEFVGLCRPAVEYERAFVEAVNQMQKRKLGCDVWSNPAVYWAAARLGNDIMSSSYPQIKARWESALDKAFERIRKGIIPNEVPPRLDELPAPGKASIPQDEAKRRIAELRDGLVSKMRMPQ